MRLGYFTMPMHPLGRDWSQTLVEDRDAIVLADKLGFYDAFVGEHLTDAAENIHNSMLFLASLIHLTKTIKLGTGTTNLSQHHPVQIANQAALFDHMAQGRFIMGISPGNLRGDSEAMLTLDKDRNKMFADAIEVILAIWEREPPYDIDFPDNPYKVTTRTSYEPHVGSGIMPKPFQKPRPEIVGTVVAPFSKGVIAMGKRDFHPLSANFLLLKWVKTHWGHYSEGKHSIGEAANPADWRVARTIFVADDDKVARDYGRDNANSPYRFYYDQLGYKLKKGGRIGVFKERFEQPDEEITSDWILDHCVMHGTVNKVVDQILAMREETGPFGEIVYAGMDFVDEKLAKRSMELMATEVMPRVNAALGETAG